MNDFLFPLLSTPTVSGFEHAGSDLFINYMSKYVNECYRDNVGNSITKLCGSDNMSIMIEAHIDEIGFQVIYLSEDGGVYIRANGGIDLHCIPGSHVDIYGRYGNVHGVIGKTPMHLLTIQEREKVTELSNLWVDTGLSIDEIKNKIKIGDIVAISPNAQFLGEHRIVSKALDDKIGVYVMAEAMKQLSTERNTLQGTIYGVATVQEEVGFRGINTVCSSLKPDYTLNIDVDFATDVPNCPKNKYGDIRLGEGVIVSCCLDSDMSEIKNITAIAEKNSIPIQLSARPMATGGTNASRARFANNGIKTILLGIPCRYMHTPVEMCDMRDVDAAIALIVEYIKMISNNLNNF